MNCLRLIRKVCLNCQYRRLCIGKCTLGQDGKLFNAGRKYQDRWQSQCQWFPGPGRKLFDNGEVLYGVRFPVGIIFYSRNAWKGIALVGSATISFSVLFLCYSVAEASEDKKKNIQTKGNTRKLCRAAKEGNIFELNKLIKSGIDVNEKNPLGWTALHAAAMSGNARIVQVLLEAGADPNAQDEFSNPYKIAARTHMRIMDVIVMREDEFCSRGLNTNANFAGFTPLHYAALSDDYECVKLLLDAGADPSIPNADKHTAAEYSERENIKEMIRSYANKYELLKKKRESEERRKFPLEKRFREVIVGQEGAITAVASAIRRRENGWYDEDHPLVFLFLGSSGIGKTELAKQLAKYLHKDNKKGFIRLDMSEYQERHEVAKMIGSPPGYIGHEEGGQLTKKLKEYPHAVVLFDEIDKAHPDVLTIMLQLFDEGRLTDGKGKTIDCKDAIFVMTSNLASEDIAEHGLELRHEAREAAERKHSDDLDDGTSEERIAVSRNFKENVIYPILKRHFRRDEFLGRITEIVYFLPFSRLEQRQLVDKELSFWAQRAMKRHDMELTWDREILDILADGYDVHYGARSLKHEVERKVVSLLAAAHEKDLIQSGCKLHLTINLPEYQKSSEKIKNNYIPNIKLQLIQKGQKKDLDIGNIYHPDIPTLF